MNKNSFQRGGNTMGTQGGNDMGSTLAPAPPPLASASGAPGTVAIQNSTPTMSAAPATSGLADMRNSGPGTAPSAYGSSPQDIVNAAYGPKLGSDMSGAGSAYGDLIAASGSPAVVPQTGGAQAPALAPPLTPRPSGIDRIPNLA